MSKADSAGSKTPDLTLGVAVDSLTDGGTLLGHVGDDDVVLARADGRVFAVGAHCTHYHGPLAQGLIVGDTVRCPWHHACFSLQTGEALRAPALDPVARWRVEAVRDRARQFTPVDQPVGAVYVREKLASADSRPCSSAVGTPRSVVIVGG